MRRLVAAIVAFGLGQVSSGLAQRGQQPQQIPPQFRGGINLVEVDVSVLDRDRKPVRGLTSSDFAVLEDGRLQQITTFSEMDVPEPVEPTAPWMRDVSSDVKVNTAHDGRLFALVLDDAQVRFDPRMMATVKEIGRRLVNRLGPSDLMAVIFTRDNRAAQDFTDDHARLLTAIDKFVPGFSHAAGPGDFSTQYFYQQTLGTLKKTAEYLGTVPQRRKALIYVSVGVPVNLGGSAQSGESTIAETMKDVLRQAQRANVNIYGIDPAGLGGLGDESPESLGIPSQEEGGSIFGSAILRNDFLRTVTENTGGFAIINTNSFASAVSQLFRENGSYYLIGYPSTNPNADGKLRRLEVRVNRPGVTVRARDSYYAPEAKKIQTPPSPLFAAGAGLLPATGMAMRASVSPFAIPGKKETALAIVLGLRQPIRQERLSETVELLTSIYGTEGQFRGSWRQTVRLTLLRSDEDAKFEVLTKLELKPGAYQLRFAVHSAALAKSGSLYYTVDVPDFSKEVVSLSGVVLTASPSISSGGKESLAALLPVVPTTQREFVGHLATAFLRVYQGGKGPLAPVTLKARITDAHDKVVFEAPAVIAAERFNPVRAADYRLDLPLARLFSGDYLLTVEAALDKRTATRDIRFTVR